jgi:hypothetical protein
MMPSALAGHDNGLAFTVAKAAVIGLTKALAFELAPFSSRRPLERVRQPNSPQHIFRKRSISETSHNLAPDQVT